MTNPPQVQSKKRVSFILSSLLLSGGVQVIVEYANRLIERGYHVTIVTPSDCRSVEISKLLTKDIEVRETLPLRRKSSILYKTYLAWSLAKAVPQSDYIIATHTPTTLVTLMIKILLHNKGQRIWFYMDYPGMFEKRKFERILLRYAILWHDMAFTLTAYSKDELSALTSTKKPIHIVGLGLSNTHAYNTLPPISKTTIEKEGKIILYLGDHRMRKGLFDFLQAAEIVYARYPSIKLWLALKDNCRVSTSLPYQCFHRPSVERLADLYKTCDLFVSSSWYEGFGLPALEAMACGAPVVLTDSGGVREYADPKSNCLLVPPKDPSALADAIYEVLSKPRLSDKFRKNGPATAARFNWEDSINKFEQALTQH